MSKAVVAGMVVGMFFGQPQLGAAIGGLMAGQATIERELSTREQAIALELRRTLSENRAGLWLAAAMIACVMALLVKVYAG